MNADMLLARARNIISDPERFSPGHLAQDREGRDVSYGSPRAWRFCSYGALDRVAFLNRVPDRVYEEAELRLENAMGGSVVGFSDSRPHAEVVAAWDRALRWEDQDGR